ncbi:hypothetical protein ACEWPM_017160 [Roseovarius sp. S4756]|uniref:hypothetical protein n=1 Tax=Roseovarius maritimus TaxID=3342637 RepID=UPI0037271CE6
MGTWLEMGQSAHWRLIMTKRCRFENFKMSPEVIRLPAMLYIRFCHRAFAVWRRQRSYGLTATRIPKNDTTVDKRPITKPINPLFCI